MKRPRAAPKKRKIIPFELAEIIKVGPLELSKINAYKVQSIITEKKLEQILGKYCTPSVELFCTEITERVYAEFKNEIGFSLGAFKASLNYISRM